MSDRRGRQRDGGGSSGGSRKSKKPKVMDATGQTKEERRVLRLKQRQLKTVIIENQVDLGDLNKNTCRELTEANGELFEKTKFPREAAADGENLKLIAEGSAGQAKKVTAGSVGVDLDDFMSNVKGIFSKKNGNEGDFNWSKWGANVSMVYLAVPEGGGFMMGPLDKPAKERKAAQRKKKPVDDAQEVRPDEEVGKGKKVKQNKDQTQERIQNMKNAERESGNQMKKQDMFEVLLNPKSFTQTVENMFDFSFLVKSGEGHISIDEETKLPQAMYTEILGCGDGAPAENGGGGGGGGGRSDAQNHKQWLMSFTQADFKELKELYELEESHVEHRNEGPTSDYYDPLKHGNRESNRQ